MLHHLYRTKYFHVTAATKTRINSTKTHIRKLDNSVSFEIRIKLKISYKYPKKWRNVLEVKIVLYKINSLLTIHIKTDSIIDITKRARSLGLRIVRIEWKLLVFSIWCVMILINRTALETTHPTDMSQCNRTGIAETQFA